MTDPSKRERLFLLIVMLAAVAVRLPGIGYSFYGDETFSILRDSKTLIPTSEDAFRPVFFSLLFLWRSMVGSGEAALRTLPLIFGILQIPVAYVMGKRLGGEKLARVLTILMAASPILIEFSQELRMYSLVTLIALVQVWLLLLLLERESLWRWCVFVLAAIIGVYTHLHYWIFLAGIAVVFLAERRNLALWKGVVALTAVVLVYLLNLNHLLEFVRIRSGDYFVDLPSALPKLFAAVTVGFNYFALSDSAAGRPVGLGDLSHNGVLAVLAILPAALILWGMIRAHRAKLQARTLIWGHALFTIPVIIALLASVVTRQYWLQPKYVIFIVPFGLLLIAEGYLALDKALMRRAAAALGLAVWVVAILHFWNPADYGRRENWRAAAEMLKSRVGPNSALIVLSVNGHGLLPYYWREVTQLWKPLNDSAAITPKAEAVGKLTAMTAGCSDVYYLWYDVRRNRDDPTDMTIRALDHLGTRAETETLNPRLRIYHWKRGD
jgi:uncharacterized membrane protein